MKKLYSKLLSNYFFKSILILASGSIIAQLINFVSSPLVTRIYSPEVMGDFTYILTIVTLFSTIINARYDISIVNEVDEEKALNLIVLSFIISFFLSIVITIGSFLFVYYFQPLFFWKYKNLLIWVFPLLFISGIINILNAYNNRHKEYMILTKVYVIRSVVQNLLMIILGFFNPVAFFLLLAQFVGQFFGIIKQSEALRKNTKKEKRIEIKKLICLAKQYIKQPLFSVPATFLNSLAYSMVNILISLAYGNVYLGLYSISYRVLGIPLSVFSSNIARVHLESSREEIIEKGNFNKSTIKTFLFSLLITIPMVLILVVFSPIVFKLVFGDSWKQAGVYVQILAPMFGLRLITGCIGYSFILGNKQQFELWFQLLLVFSLVVSSIVITLCNLTIIYCLLLISVLFSIVYFFEILFMLKVSREI